MQRYADVIQDKYGNGIRAQIVVYLTGTATLATLFSDNGVAPQVNPLSTDADGRFDFYAVNGRYDLSITALGFDPVTYHDVSLFDSADATPADIIAELGYHPEDIANKSDNGALGSSTTLYPTQRAAKAYADVGDAATLATADSHADNKVAAHVALSDPHTQYVKKTTTVNGHALSANVTVTASDVGAPSGSGNSTGTNTGDQPTVDVATHAASSKTAPVDADELPLTDSASAFGLAKLTWANLKATVKTYLDTLYQTLANLSTNTALGTSNTLYPSQNAVKVYVDAGDATTLASAKTYTDSAITALDAKDPAAYCSTSDLSANYANGSLGVGATLTSTSNGPLIIDGVTTVLAAQGLRILVAGQSSAFQNGWYILTQQGVLLTSPWILTRDTASDQAAEIESGYLTAVEAPSGLTAGSSNNQKVFISIAPSPVVVGTDSITFAMVGGTYTAGTGLTLSGTQFSLNSHTIDGQTYDGSSNITVIAPGTHAATSKSTPVDADEMPLVDSAASNVLKKLTWLNLKATLKTYFDTLYATAGGSTTLTGDVTGSGVGTVATTLANVPTGTPHAGSALFTNIAAPSTPASGKTSVYVDSTSKNIAAKNDAGTVNHGVQTKAAVSNSFVTAIADDGTVSVAQPTDANLSTSDVTTNNVSSTKHGFAPKSPADATQFLNGAATPAFAAVKDSDLATTDITTNNVSTSKHGFAPKAPNDATKYLDGTGAYSVPASSSVAANRQTFTSAGTATWTKPGGFASTAMVLIECWGGGGGGGRGSSGSGSGGGGGGGSYKSKWVPLSSLGSTESYTVGAAGTGATSNNSAGVNGGASIFGTTPIVTAYGGTAGNGSSSSTTGGPGGGLHASATAGTGTTDTPEGVPGGGGSTAGGGGYFTGGGGGGGNTGGAGGDGGHSVYGGGGGGGSSSSGGSNGGTSQFAGAGGTGADNSPTAGTAPSGGGGGGRGGNGAAGAAGQIIVTVFPG